MKKEPWYFASRNLYQATDNVSKRDKDQKNLIINQFATSFLESSLCFEVDLILRQTRKLIILIMMNTKRIHSN